MDCLSPPVEEAPPGDWYCPLCTPSTLDGEDDPDATEAEIFDGDADADLTEPEMFVSCPPRGREREEGAGI